MYSYFTFYYLSKPNLELILSECEGTHISLKANNTSLIITKSLVEI